MTEYSYSPEKGLTLRSGFGFSCVYVIESLKDVERKTGEELYHDLLKYEKINDPNIIVEYREVNNREELFKELESIHDILKSTGKVPLIHFETHGNKDGIALKSDEFVPYKILLPLLREINIIAQNNLFIVVAACNGGNMSFIIKDCLNEACPFFGVLGPTEMITAKEVINGYKAF